jgi:hypothetical protein
MDDLIVTLGRGGELQEALSMKQAVLAKRQQILGKDHPDTWRTMHNLAATLADLLWEVLRRNGFWSIIFAGCCLINGRILQDRSSFIA